MGNVSDKSCKEDQTHILCSITVFENIAMYEIMWENIVEPDMPDGNTTRCMRIACCLLKATHTHSEYVILIVLPLQQWLHERTPV